MTDLNPLRFTKLDFHGNHLYTWMVPKELPDGYLEVHTFTVRLERQCCTAATTSTDARRSSCRRPGADPEAAHPPTVGCPSAWLRHGSVVEGEQGNAEAHIG